MAQDEDDKKTDELPTLKKLPTLPIRVILPKAAEGKRVTNLLDDYAELLREERAAYLANIGLTKSVERDNRVERVSNELRFSKSDLNEFVSHRKIGLAKKSLYWIDSASNLVWESTKGEVSSRTLTALRQMVLEKYNSIDSHSKVLSFATSFLKFLATTRTEPQYQAFAPYLELPKALKERKNVTERIVTKEDIENVLRYVKQAEKDGTLDSRRSAFFSAFVIFGAFTGQRSMSTIAKLTVGQFREALQRQKPVLHVESGQDKIRMEHYVPLHPRVVSAIEAILGDRKNEDRAFGYNSFQMWMKRHPIPMSRFKGHFELGDLRKFAEQHGDIIEWEQSNRKYVLTHGVSGVDWSHYKHPLPDSVYDIYMKYWGGVSLKS